QIARRLAAAGCLVAVPTLISRSDEFSGSRRVGYTNLTHREFLYRQAFEVGRHIIGFEVQKILAAVDLFENLNHSGSGLEQQGSASARSPLPIGVVGVGEGGLLALYAAAVDRRIKATVVSGYFQQREGVWKEPIYRNVWGLLSEFGDAELAGLIAPRRLVIEACRGVVTTGPPAVRRGRRQAAAPGRIAPISVNSVRNEFQRCEVLFRKLKLQDQLVLAVSGKAGDGPPGTARALAAFAAGLGIQNSFDATPQAWRHADHLGAEVIAGRTQTYAKMDHERQHRQFQELQQHIQALLRRSPIVREATWKTDLSSVATWIPDRDRLRKQVHDEVIGRLPIPRIPLRPRTRRILETDAYSGYEVVLDVDTDVVASGILLIPKAIKVNEKRPVVVCQHGLEGTPLDTISRKPDAFRYYKAFSDQLCRRGFIVYAPQNPYRGGDRFRSIQRKANPLQRSLFSFIIAQHQRTLDWLVTLPQVDAERIAFYGLSYGGKTAMRVPPFVDRYCLSICSGDFTDWVRTITTVDYRYGYIFTGEYEIPEWNMAHVASYAELAMLMSPRPFMVEQGHRDGGTPTEWVAGEFGKVRRHYDLLKIGNRAEIELFDGPHTINGRGTFEFLHRHLDHPVRGRTP
ncbi:MAG: prolyl oligopeptidase family serine peptidase, partial [Planctomycetaceae bacterium]